MIRKFSAVFLVLLLIMSAVFSVGATGDIEFSLSNVECSNNRLFTVDILASGNQELSAVIFELEYDNEMINYREIKCDDSNSKVVAKDSNGKIKISFLNPSGKNISDGAKICSLTFKSIKEGSCRIDLTASDCVGSDLEFIDIKSCTSSNVNIGKSNTDKSEKDNSKDSNNKDKSSNISSSKTKSTQNEATQADKNSTTDNLGFFNFSNSDSKSDTIIGIAIGAGVTIAVFFGMYLYKLHSEKRIIKTQKEADKKQ